MSAKNIIAAGVGFSPGSVRFMPTRGLGVTVAPSVVPPNPPRRNIYDLRLELRLGGWRKPFGITPPAPAVPSRYFVVSDRHSGVLYEFLIPLNKLDATVDPTATDDSTKGYAVGSVWVNTVGLSYKICVSATPGAAVWL